MLDEASPPAMEAWQPPLELRKASVKFFWPEAEAIWLRSLPKLASRYGATLKPVPGLPVVVGDGLGLGLPEPLGDGLGLADAEALGVGEEPPGPVRVMSSAP